MKLYTGQKLAYSDIRGGTVLLVLEVSTEHQALGCITLATTIRGRWPNVATRKPLVVSLDSIIKHIHAGEVEEL